MRWCRSRWQTNVILYELMMVGTVFEWIRHDNSCATPLLHSLTSWNLRFLLSVTSIVGHQRCFGMFMVISGLQHWGYQDFNHLVHFGTDIWHVQVACFVDSQLQPILHDCQSGIDVQNCNFTKLCMLQTWIDWISVYFHDCTFTCHSTQQFGRHLPTACRAAHQQHLFVVLLPCFSNTSRWQNTLNWWKYCSKRFLRVNCCHCNRVTTCRIETWRTMAWRQILWCFYASRELCDIVRWRHVYFDVSCRDLFKMCVGDESTLTPRKFSDFGDESTLTPRNFSNLS